MKTKTYSELIALPTWEERFEYAKLDGIVGIETFGSHRYLNQKFYSSKEWRNFRRAIIVRDLGNDLGADGFEIAGEIVIHHLNPITLLDIVNGNWNLVLGEWNVVCVSQITHRALHYGSIDRVPHLPKERQPNDTCPWKSPIQNGRGNKHGEHLGQYEEAARDGR